MKRDGGKEILPDVEREDKLADWVVVFRRNGMRITVAGVLQFLRTHLTVN
jgi:hypothetical protein